jgi:ligand-binding sensor domain-containing protein
MKRIRERVTAKPIRQVLAVLLLAIGTSGLQGQDRLGEWKTHLPYVESRQIVEAGTRLYCGSLSGLFYIDREFNTVHIMTKSDGLSDLEINALNYTESRNSLIIGYANTNIDIIEGNEIYNIPDIKRKQITGNKTINNILILEDAAYLSCGFGIVVVNLEKKEIKETYLIGENGGYTNVYDMASDESHLYAATEQGIYYAEIDHPNLVDFNNWSHLSDIPHAAEQFGAICWTGERLYAAYNSANATTDTLFYRENGAWKVFQTREHNRIRTVRESAGNLVVIAGFFTSVYNSQDREIRAEWSLAPGHALYDGYEVLWIADRAKGLYRSPSKGEKESIAPNGPLSRDVSSIAIMEDMLYTAAGNVKSDWNNTWNPAELNYLQGNYWQGTQTTDYRDLLTLAIDPADKNHVFGASWGYGLLEYRNGELVEVFDQTNSTLQTLPNGDIYHRIGGCVFDSDGHLWMNNSAVAEPVSVKKTDGTWKSFKLDGKLKVSFLGRMINTSLDHKWIICAHGEGLFAFDVNRTIDDISDDRYEKFSVLDLNGKVISNDVYSLAEDREGNIWVGTDKGIVVYYSPSRVFDEDLFYGQQIIVPRNDGTGLADILLGTERVTAIAVDGANRKWLGTEQSGIYLVSEDGLEEIHHFTEDNSPLLSNKITDIAINGENGLVYIGTNAGLISFKGKAIEGRKDYSGVYAYPNPVRHDYDGEIVITGLVGNVNVKITDIGGNIVYETTSLGGQAIWDGRSFSGRRVSTGVYMIFCTDDEGNQTHITKLLVIH